MPPRPALTPRPRLRILLGDAIAIGPGKADLLEAIERCGKSRVIFARCDSPEAVRFGYDLGITLFQGRFIDSLMQEETRFGMTSFTL